MRRVGRARYVAGFAGAAKLAGDDLSSRLLLTVKFSARHLVSAWGVSAIGLVPTRLAIHFCGGMRRERARKGHGDSLERGRHLLLGRTEPPDARRYLSGSRSCSRTTGSRSVAAPLWRLLAAESESVRLPVTSSNFRASALIIEDRHLQALPHPRGLPPALEYSSQRYAA